MIIEYGITFGLSIALLVVYFLLLRRKDLWLTLFFVCVAVIDLGYFLLSLSKTLWLAVFANDLSYFGNIFINVCLFFIIFKLCGFEPGKRLVALLISLGVAMFAIVATSGFLPLYYESVKLEAVEGGFKLVKEYGILHPLYLAYVIGYFAAMIITIVRSIRLGKIGSHKFAGLIVGVVCGNILVWLFEKFISWEFEFLALTYIFSGAVLILLYWMIQDYVHVNDVPRFTAEEVRRLGADIVVMPMEAKIGMILPQLQDGALLTPREREILEMILENKKRKDIATALYLSENTVKTYTRTLYAKLGVNCREELYSLLLRKDL